MPMARLAPRASSTPLPRMGMIGLGIMGGAMAESLLKSGYTVCGFDISPAAKKRLKQAKGQSLASVAEVVAQSDVLIVSLSTSAALAQVTQEIAQARRTHKTGAPLLLETSTLTLADKDACAKQLRAVGVTTLDCPISGTAVRLKERAWTVYVSGPKTAYAKARAIFEVFTDNVAYVGPYGSGTKMKFAANHLVAIYNVAYAESVTLARKMGLDPREMYKLFANSPVLGTGVMRLRMAMMLERDYTPPTMKVEVWQKDMDVIGEMAKSVDCPTPLFTASASVYTAAMAQGLALEDTAATAEVLGAMAGVPARPKTKR